MSDLAIIIPTYNEEATIGPLVAACREYGKVVVVDASSDNMTTYQASKAGAIVRVCPKSDGIGGAILDGMHRSIGAEQVVTIDAGGSHDPADIPRLLEKDADVVIGSRFCDGGQYHGRPWRAWCSQLVSEVCRGQNGTFLWDWTSGFRAYSFRAVRYMMGWPFNTKGHAWQIEALGYLLEEDCTIAEVPIVYKAGRSSLWWGEMGEVVTAIRGLR